MGIKEKWKRHKPLPEDIEKRLKTLMPLFKRKGVFLVYLFGSSVRGKGEDVDLAVLWDGNFARLREDINKHLGTWRVDIVNLKLAPLWLTFEVISTGRILYKKSDELENGFELKILKTYKDRKPTRHKQFQYLKENLGIGT